MAGCGECGGEPSGSCATELVIYINGEREIKTLAKTVIYIYYTVCKGMQIYKLQDKLGKYVQSGNTDKFKHFPVFH
jgi:hypothetical protein